MKHVYLRRRGGSSGNLHLYPLLLEYSFLCFTSIFIIFLSAVPTCRQYSRVTHAPDAGGTSEVYDILKRIASAERTQWMQILCVKGMRIVSQHHDNVLNMVYSKDEINKTSQLSIEDSAFIEDKTGGASTP
eukprot:GHVQ01025666.1.p1 GENE.GHVQ01025666.1~~GHVQ01025666.1.p1  ORF type:complete len:131 (-),score=20.83 GHVQ01025666.1:219-611(-)